MTDLKQALSALYASPLLDPNRPYEEVAAEYQALQEKEARLWMLDRWRAYRAMEAARSGQLVDRGDQAIPRRLGLPDALVTGRAAAFEQTLEDSLRLDEGAPHPPQGALADLLAQAPVAGGEPLDVAGRPARGRLHPGEDAQGGGVVGAVGRSSHVAGVAHREHLLDARGAGQFEGPLQGQAALGPALKGVVNGHGHAGESEAVPAAGQARSDAEKAPAGGLPAVASFW